jgi:hypothetical protein
MASFLEVGHPFFIAACGMTDVGCAIFAEK